MLADEAISFFKENRVPVHSCEALAKCAMNSVCDNCRNSGGKICITEFVTSLSSFAKRNPFDWKMYQTATLKIKKLPSALKAKFFLDFPMQADLHRYMQTYGQKSFFSQLSAGKVGVYVSNGLVEALPTVCRHWYAIESIGLPMQHNKATTYPFVLRFERDRLGLNLEEIFNNETPKVLSAACEQLFAKSKTKHPQYLSTMRAAERNEVPIFNVLFYRAKLKIGGSLELLEPQRADDKRIYRLYGSERFLEISIANDVSRETIKTFLSGDVTVANRRFEFFWFKREAGIHPVLFAVSGQGINKVSVQDARDRCIPSKYNLGISLGKWVKRMKLNFSTTTATCVLPPNSVDLIKDFEDEGVAQIDGAGLISSMALQAVWEGYNKRLDNTCRFSGFQGRLAG
jgi:RNA dependent RNA polymerase